MMMSHPESCFLVYLSYGYYVYGLMGTTLLAVSSRALATTSRLQFATKGHTPSPTMERQPALTAE